MRKYYQLVENKDSTDIYIYGEYKGDVDLDEDDLRMFKEWSDYNGRKEVSK